MVCAGTLPSQRDVAWFLAASLPTSRRARLSSAMDSAPGEVFATQLAVSSHRISVAARNRLRDEHMAWPLHVKRKTDTSMKLLPRMKSELAGLILQGDVIVRAK